MKNEEVRTAMNTRTTSRLFIAMPLSAAVRDQVDNVQRQLQPLGWPVKWVDSRLAHITLKFLGETANGMIPVIEDMLRSVTCSEQPITLNSDSCGAFPSLERPQVIWIGVTGQTERAVRLADAVDRAMVDIEFGPERRAFSPHITIGRVRRGERLGADAGQTIRQVDVPPVTMVFDRIHLVRSDLGRTGPTYTTLSEWHFGNLSARRVELVEHG